MDQFQAGAKIKEIINKCNKTMQCFKVLKLEELVIKDLIFSPLVLTLKEVCSIRLRDGSQVVVKILLRISLSYLINCSRYLSFII